ncbi:MAG: hypothetical protein IPK46_23135 [Saprospiraceae bacterium]|nr:hypothetical protein [Saprospiraceae bacterium]
MGVLSSLKKLLFATESVAKSAVNKAEEFVDEKFQDLTPRKRMHRLSTTLVLRPLA